MDMIGWAALLLAIGFALAVIEMFVPSGGVLGVISGLAIVAAVGIAFTQRTWYGLGFLSIVLIGLPIVFAGAVQIWPKTRIGRRFLLTSPSANEVLPDNDLRRGLKSLVGRYGRVQSPMMPSGSVLIDNRPVDATTEGIALDPGAWVQVIEVRGARVVVRPSAAPPQPADPLAQTFDDAAPPGFDDPFA